MRLEDICWRGPHKFASFEVPRSKWTVFDNRNGTYDFIKPGPVDEDHIRVDALTAQCLLHAILAGEI
jgi:hypothetical protein